MIQLKDQNLASGYKFDYASILIGTDRTGMDLINVQMKGKSEWVNNASQISNVFREILLTKN